MEAIFVMGPDLGSKSRIVFINLPSDCEPENRFRVINIPEKKTGLTNEGFNLERSSYEECFSSYDISTSEAY